MLSFWYCPCHLLLYCTCSIFSTSVLVFSDEHCNNIFSEFGESAPHGSTHIPDDYLAPIVNRIPTYCRDLMAPRYNLLLLTTWYKGHPVTNKSMMSALIKLNNVQSDYYQHTGLPSLPSCESKPFWLAPSQAFEVTNQLRTGSGTPQTLSPLSQSDCKPCLSPLQLMASGRYPLPTPVVQRVS